jgi:hypothetical protein
MMFESGSLELLRGANAPSNGAGGGAPAHGEKWGPANGD